MTTQVYEQGQQALWPPMPERDVTLVQIDTGTRWSGLTADEQTAIAEYCTALDHPHSGIPAQPEILRRITQATLSTMIDVWRHDHPGEPAVFWVANEALARWGETTCAERTGTQATFCAPVRGDPSLPPGLRLGFDCALSPWTAQSLGRIAPLGTGAQHYVAIDALSDWRASDNLNPTFDPGGEISIDDPDLMDRAKAAHRLAAHFVAPLQARWQRTEDWDNFRAVTFVRTTALRLDNKTVLRSEAPIGLSMPLRKNQPMASFRYGDSYIRGPGAKDILIRIRDRTAEHYQTQP